VRPGHGLTRRCTRPATGGFAAFRRRVNSNVRPHETHVASMHKSGGRRQLLFGGAFLLAACLGCLYVYWQGVETGALRLGSRNPQLIALADSPERFQFWLRATLIAAVLFAVLGLASLWAALRRNNA
jgi:hypothetical protein